MGKIICNLLINPTYILSVLAITNVMFIVTGLQFWATQYGTTVLKGDELIVYITFSATVLTSPCVGALAGGIVTTKFLTSYTNPKALSLCFGVYILFVIFCIPCPFVDNYYFFIGFMWVAIFM